MFAGALAVSQVTAPHLYDYDLTLMLLAVLLVIGSSQWSEESRQRVVLLAVIVILYTPPVYILLLRWQAMYILAPVLVVFALAAISLARKAELPLA
jgi:predicted branched-subunit amino acid permease